MENKLREMPAGIITLTTDFGLKDPYVAAMKGVLLSICPKVLLVDVSHDISPGSIREAADMLAYIFPFFPKGTVHVAVVDPGVGGDRRSIVVKAGGHFFVGPDNGIFWPMMKRDPETRVISLSNEIFFRKPVSKTFHGRDIFAPVAAYLASGKDPSDMGELILNPVELHIKTPVVEPEAIIAEVIRVDRFGNLITNLREETLYGFLEGCDPLIQVGNLTIKEIHSCYVDVPKGAPLALWGSGGFLEISINCGRAAKSIGMDDPESTGVPIRIRRNESICS